MKPIKLTDEYNANLMEALKAQILGTKTNNGRININIDLKELIKPADKKEMDIIFSAVAFIKYTTLVQHNSDEIGWHGTVARLSDTEFLIKDIFVYPQTVTGASVSPDQAEYQKWLYEFEDEDFNTMRFHGHSHVNMGTSPSGVDMNFRQEILDQLTNEDFYIFSIHNKKGDREINLYDMKTNWIYETADINVKVMLDGQTTKEFIKESDAQVKTLRNTVYGNVYGFTNDDPYSNVRSLLRSDDETHLMTTKEEKELKRYLNKQEKKKYNPDKEVREYVKRHEKLNS